MTVDSRIKENYFRRILVPVSSKTAYHALTDNIGKWWTEPEGNASNIGDTPTFHFDEGNTHWKMKVLNLVPNEFIHWECIEASHFSSNLDEDAKEEWLGTKLEWKFQHKNGKTEISLLHEGLSPELKCFNICERGWDFFFVTKLKEYLSS